MFSADLRARYEAAAHAMQSGAAVDQESGSTDGSPKHLRVGINSAMVEASALARLLIAKGVIGEGEYAEAITVGMEEEAARYAQLLSDRYGISVTLA